MRKIAVILLLSLLLFNWFGYRIVTYHLQHKADRQLEAKLDIENYDVSQLIELKIPLNMPYQSNRPDFERVDGEIEIDGVLYKYVKRKVINDSLILLCLPNEQKMKIENAKDDFFKQVNDLHATSPNNAPGKNNASTFKNILSDYLLLRNDWITPPISNQMIIYFSENCDLLGSLSLDTAERPPNC